MVTRRLRGMLVVTVLGVLLVGTSGCGGGGASPAAVASVWARSGTGANVFDMPTYVSRVKITGVLTGGLEKFVVNVAGRLVVNEIIGNRSGYQQRFEGTYLTSGGVTEVVYSSGVAWTFEQVQ